MTWSSSEKPFGKSKVVFFYIHNIRQTERFWVYADNKITRHLSPHSRKLNKHIVFGPRSVPTAFRIKNIWLRRCERVLIVSQSILCFSHVRDLSQLFQSFSFMFARIWTFRIAGPKSSKLLRFGCFSNVCLKNIQNTYFFKKHPRCCRATGEHWRALASISGSLSSNWRALASTGEQMVMLGELQILPHICTLSSVLVCFVCFSVFCLLFHVLYVFHCFCRFCAVSKALRQK